MKPSEDPSESSLRLAPTVLLLAGMLVFGVGGIFLYGARTEARFSRGMCPECSRKHSQAP